MQSDVRTSLGTERAVPVVAADAAPPRGPVVRLSGVRKTYGSMVAVGGIDLDIGRGEFFTFLGPSGSGKTTTLRLIAGFERPDAGRIDLDGRDVARLAPFDRDVNTVFQDYALFPHMNVLDNVAYGLRARRVPEQAVLQRAQAALAMVRLEGLGTRRPAEMSGGQRQRVALARAIVNHPRVLLLDEPLGALDLKLRQEMQVELKRIQQEVGITFIYVTHDQEEALTMSDRVAVFNHGRIEQVDTPSALYERPRNAFVARFVGAANILTRGGRAYALRPEKVRLALDRAELADLPAEPAMVREAVYAGMFTRYRVELGDGGSLAVVEQNVEQRMLGPRIAPGTQALVGWRAGSMVPLDDSGETGREQK